MTHALNYFQLLKTIINDNILKQFSCFMFIIQNAKKKNNKENKSQTITIFHQKTVV